MDGERQDGQRHGTREEKKGALLSHGVRVQSPHVGSTMHERLEHAIRATPPHLQSRAVHLPMLKRTKAVVLDFSIVRSRGSFENPYAPGPRDGEYILACRKACVRERPTVISRR